MSKTDNETFCWKSQGNTSYNQKLLLKGTGLLSSAAEFKMSGGTLQKYKLRGLTEGVMIQKA